MKTFTIIIKSLVLLVIAFTISWVLCFSVKPEQLRVSRITMTDLSMRLTRLEWRMDAYERGLRPLKVLDSTSTDTYSVIQPIDSSARVYVMHGWKGKRKGEGK